MPSAEFLIGASPPISLVVERLPFLYFQTRVPVKMLVGELLPPMQPKLQRILHSFRRRPILFWTLIVLLAVYDLRHLPSLFAVGRHTGADFLGYWASGRIFLSGGNPYDSSVLLPLEQSLGWPDLVPLVMWSPPWTYILILPFIVLPFVLGRVLWFLVNLILLMWAADYFWLENGGAAHRRWLAWLGVLLFVPSAIPLNTGQISPLLLLGTLAFLWAASKHNDLLAGLFLLPLAAKPHVLYLFMIFVALWTLKERRWKILIGISGSLMVCILISFIINPSIYIHYFQALQSNYGPYIWQTPTIVTVLRRLFPAQGFLLLYLFPSMGTVIGLFSWLAWRRRFSWKRYLIPILLISVLTAPYVWALDFIVLLPLALIMMIRFQQRPDRQLPWLIGLIAAQVIMLLQLFFAESYFSFVWVAPALALLYWLSGRSQESDGIPA